MQNWTHPKSLVSFMKFHLCMKIQIKIQHASDKILAVLNKSSHWVLGRDVGLLNKEITH